MVGTDDNGKVPQMDTVQRPNESRVMYAARLAQRAALTADMLRHLDRCAAPVPRMYQASAAIDAATLSVRQMWEHQLYGSVRSAAHAAAAFVVLTEEGLD